MAETNRNGSFHVSYSQGYATLSVEPPQGLGHAVYVDDVQNRLRLLGAPHVRAQVIRDIIERASGKPEPLVPWPEGDKLSSRIEIRVSEDKMEAFLRIHAPKKGGGTPDLRQIKETLTANGVLHGIDEAEIRRIAADPVFDRYVRVAAGTPPVHGRPRSAKLSFEADTGRPYLLKEGGRIDLKELRFIQNKAEGDVLARFVPPVQPRNGTDVRGAPVTSEQPRCELIPDPGKNTELSSDGTAIIATVTGHVFLESNRINVEPVVTVPNVNYETGNIDFIGSVVVRRTIADGFTVKATGSIQVGECVGRCEIRADRDIALLGGVNADHEGIIQCGGNLVARYIEGANVICSGDLLVHMLIMHSSVTASGNIVLQGRRAEIVGGYAVAGGSIWCKQAGSVSEVSTRLTVGVDPAMLAEFAALRRKLDEKRQELDDVERALHRAERQATGESRVTAKLLEQRRNAVSSQVGGLVERHRALRESLVAPADAMAVVENMMFPGVAVSFGREEYRVGDRPVRRTVLRFVDEEIVESGFNPNDPPKLRSAQSPAP